MNLKSSTLFIFAIASLLSAAIPEALKPVLSASTKIHWNQDLASKWAQGQAMSIEAFVSRAGIPLADKRAWLQVLDAQGEPVRFWKEESQDCLENGCYLESDRQGRLQFMLDLKSPGPYTLHLQVFRPGLEIAEVSSLRSVEVLQTGKHLTLFIIIIVLTVLSGLFFFFKRSGEGHSLVFSWRAFGLKADLPHRLDVLPYALLSIHLLILLFQFVEPSWPLMTVLAPVFLILFFVRAKDSEKSFIYELALFSFLFSTLVLEYSHLSSLSQTGLFPLILVLVIFVFHTNEFVSLPVFLVLLATNQISPLFFFLFTLILMGLRMISWRKIKYSPVLEF